MNELIKYENGVYSSINDDNKYITYKLPNGLKIFLIEDKSTIISSAVMHVNVGSNNNPKNFEGMAHFLEHMLFMGSKKYHGGSFFQDEVSKNGGMTNAFTTDNCTQYYFNSSENFIYLLDIFSGFFTDPLFDIKYIEREINAIDSEHKKNIGNDHWRFMEIAKNIFIDDINNRFTTGTKELLLSSVNNDYEKLRNIMMTFYNNYYTANNMTLFISHNTIDNIFIEKMNELFAGIPMNQNNKTEIINLPIIRKNEINTIELIKMKSTEDNIYLSLFWLLDGTSYCDDNNNIQDGYEVLSYILNSKNEKSLYCLLNKEKYISDMYSYVDKIFDKHCLYCIRIRLTDLGYQNWLVIIYCISLYIKNLSINDVFDVFYNEMHMLHKLDLKIYNKIDGLTLCQYYAEIYDTKKHVDLSYLPIAYARYDIQKCKKHFNNCLNFMTIANVKTIITSNIFKNLKLIDKFYGTEYDIQIINTRGINIDKSYFGSYLIPQLNKYIPDTNDLQLIESVTMNDTEENYLQIKSKNNNIYFAKNKNTFNTYSIYGIIEIETINNNVDNWMKLLIYFKYINKIRTNEKHLLKTAKINIDIIPQQKGITIIIDGYNSNNKIDNVFEKVFNWYFQINEIDNEIYEDIYNEIMINLQDYKFTDPYEMIVPELKCIIDKNNVYSNQDMIHALQQNHPKYLCKINKNFNKDINEFITKGSIVGVFGGSIDMTQIENIINILDKRIIYAKNNHISYDPVNKPINILKTNENPNNKERACCYGLFLGSTKELSMNDEWMIHNIFCEMTMTFISENFSSYIRTDKQLGYIAKSSLLNVNTKKDPYTYLLFISQSTEKDILIIIKDYVENIMMKDIMTIDDNIYHNLKTSFINNLLEKPQNIHHDCNEIIDCIQKTYDIDYFINNKNDRFDRKKKISKYLSKTTKDHFFDFVNSINRSFNLMIQIVPL